MPNYPPGALIPPTPAPLPSLTPGAAGAVALSGGVFQEWSGSAWSSLLAMRGQALFNGFSMGKPVAIKASGTAAGTINSTQTTVTTGLTQPDVPRTLDIVYPSQWNGGNITIHGTDALNNIITELYAAAPGSTVPGTAVFATITSLTNSVAGADTHNATVELGATIGLPYFPATSPFAPQSTLQVVMIFWVNLTANTQGWYILPVTAGTSTVNLTASSGLPSGAGVTPDGETIYFVIGGN